MSELALRKFVADELTTHLSLPTGTGRLKTFTAHRQAFKREILGGHVVIEVGKMRAREVRDAGARGIGKKTVTWVVDLAIAANGKNADPMGGAGSTQTDADDFSVLVDNVKKVFRQQSTTALVATLTDPQTSETSTLTHIGEVMDHETLEPDMEQLQGRILFRALLSLTAVEVISPY